MDIQYFIDSFKQNVNVIGSLVKDISIEQARWKPKPDKWSILEVINHLYDEEKDDFRKRLDMTLHSPAEDWPSIDPEGWVKDRNYNQKDFKKSLNNFIAERETSLNWLESLSSQNWQTTYHHTKIGPIRAGDLLAAWLAHDYLHLRQLSSLKLAYIDKIAEPFHTRYASP